MLGGCGEKARASKAPAPPSAVTVTPSEAAAADLKPLPKRPAGPTTLRTYYLYDKYTAEERQAVSSGLRQVFSHWTHQELHQGEAEVLAFHHVVFNPTEWHDLTRNHGLVRKYESKLRELCERHGVPPLPVMAIVSWENSGGTAKVSWADAAGLGQMTWGAVEEAHRFASAESRRLLEEARWKKYMAGVTGDPAAMKEARALASQAAQLDLEGRHRQMAHAAGVPDERSLVECNLEDVVVFFKYLMSNYGGRVDHAIGAYHKGVTNTDDIIYDYLKRKDSTVAYPGSDRTAFVEAMERHKVTYMTLWNDRRTREMLNGLRTVEGEPTNWSNAHMALGDESDIYPWKVLGSLSAYLAGEQHLARMVQKYNGRQDAIEVAGLPGFGDFTELEQAVAQGRMIRTTAPIADVGISARAARGGVGEKYSYFVTPELDGYLWHLTTRLRHASGNADVRLPVAALSEAHALERGDTLTVEEQVHLKGASVTVVPGRLSEAQAKALDSLITRDYLMDRIYRRTKSNGEVELCLNPRFGAELLDLQARYSARRTASAQPQNSAGSAAEL